MKITCNDSYDGIERGDEVSSLSAHKLNLCRRFSRSTRWSCSLSLSDHIHLSPEQRRTIILAQVVANP